MPAIVSAWLQLAVSHACVKGPGQVPCWPGQEACGAPFESAPTYHLMDQQGCGENDPNGPVFDPVHGVIHHFYQRHLAADQGAGPIYGHFASKDFVHWAQLPVAIWNGLDSSHWPPQRTYYDDVAIYTGSAVVLEGAGPKGARGIVQIYPGLCSEHSWPLCDTGTLLAQAVPASYATDELLTNWTKPSYNPIIENTQRDPTTPWKDASGEWKLRTFDGGFYGAASDADLLKGRWYDLGRGPDDQWPVCECPSFFPLPGPTPGFEAEYQAAENLPSHVQKLSCEGKDWWMMGTYESKARQVGSFTAAKGWEDLYARKLIDAGKFYASKDAEYPDRQGRARRVNWGWAQVPPQSAQSLPRELSFNAAARQIQQAPLAELVQLRQNALAHASGQVTAFKELRLRLPPGSAKHSESVVVLELPQRRATLRVGFASSKSSGWMEGMDLPGRDYVTTQHPNGTAEGCRKICEEDNDCRAWSFVMANGTSAECRQKFNVLRAMASGSMVGVKVQEPFYCAVDYQPVTGEMADVDVRCGDFQDRLRLLRGEQSLEIRIFADATFLEVFFQQGRLAMTVDAAPLQAADLVVKSTAEVTVTNATVFPMKSIWVSEDFLRRQQRIYPSQEATII